MADNVALNDGTGTRKAAADEVTYSGDTALVQLVKLVTVAGAEGSKTATDAALNTNGRKSAGNSTPTVLSDEDLAAINALGTLLTAIADQLPATLGQKAKAAALAVSIASDQGEVGKTYTGIFNVAGATLTRPANVTAYTANDSISDNATAGSVTAKSSNNLSDTNDAPIDLSEILLTSTDTGPGTAGIQIRLHLFNSDPTASSGVVGGDNAAWSNKQAGWVGSFSGTMRAFSDGSVGVLVADEGTLRLINPVTSAKNLYWQLQTLGAFTPSANSTTFTPRFKGFQARVA